MTLSVSDVTMKSTLMSQWARKLNILQDFSILVCLDSFPWKVHGMNTWGFGYAQWNVFVLIYFSNYHCGCNQMEAEATVLEQSKMAHSRKCHFQLPWHSASKDSCPVAWLDECQRSDPGGMSRKVPSWRRHFGIWPGWGPLSQMCPLDGHMASKLEPPMNLAKWPIWSRPQCNQYTI